MQTYLSSTSPVLSYSPCRGCNASTGFVSWDSFAGINDTGTDSGMVTTASSASVALNFTGTAVQFDLDFSTSFPWSTSLLVNGTTQSGTNGTTLSNLPSGRHLVELTLRRPSTMNNGTIDWARVNGVQGTLGMLVGVSTTNQTIDDTAWRTNQVILTPAWNMLEQGQSNWINASEYYAELPTATFDYNSSISWTELSGAGNLILFNGSAVWAYGIVGGEAGTFGVSMDNISQGVFDASGGSRVYGQVLFHTSGLSEGLHTLALTAVTGRLSFDRLISTQNLVPVSASGTTGSSTSASIVGSSSSTLAASSSSSSSSSSPSTSSSDTALIIGIAVCAGVIVLALSIWSIVAWTRIGRLAKVGIYASSKHDSRGGDTSQTFWRWSIKEKTIRPFVPLMDDLSGPKIVDFSTSRPLHEGTPGAHFHTALPSFSESISTDPSSRFHSTTPLPVSSGIFKLSSPPRKPRLKQPTISSNNTSSISAPRPIVAVPGVPNPLIAALGGAHSPLTTLQHSFSTDAPTLDIAPPKTQHDPPPQIRIVSDLAADEYMYGDCEERQSLESFEILSAYGQVGGYSQGGANGRSTVDMFLGSPTDEDGSYSETDRHATLSARPSEPISIIPDSLPERSPRRRFFGQAMATGRPTSNVSSKTQQSVGSLWRYM